MLTTHDHWGERVDGETADAKVRETIAESWQRSRATGVDPERIEARLVSKEELARRQAENGLLLELALPHLEWLGGYLGCRPHGLYLLDADGVVIWSRGSCCHTPIAPGVDWSEAQMGTNAAGTALVTKAPVAVVGREHWLHVWQQCTSVAAPIVGPRDELVAAIAVTSGADCAPGERLSLVAHVAWTIDREIAATLLRQAMLHRDRAISLAQQAIHSISRPLVVVAACSTIARANEAASAMFGGYEVDLQGVEVVHENGERTSLATALFETALTGRPVQRDDIEIVLDGRSHALVAHVSPVWDGADVIGAVAELETRTRN